LKPLPQTEVSAPLLLEALLKQAEQAGASDIHLQMLGKQAQIAFRLDGVISPAVVLREDVAERVFGRIKFLAKLKTYQDSIPQDGRIDKADLGARTDVRVSTYPTVTGEKIVLRLFETSEAPGLTRLGLGAEVLSELQSFLRQSTGLLLLTGPAGSGKTTTIYACLRELASQGGRHIITIEDPVEQIIPGVMQTEINEARGLDFAKAAKHLLRQDPQVLVIGEIRDEETAGIAVRAAMTGHLMISTLHAGECRTVVERLLHLSTDSFAALACLELIVNQRLLRRACTHCAGKGCEHCLGTGYRGRVPVLEWCRVDENLRRKIKQHGASEILPGQDLRSAAKELVRKGITNKPELERVLGA
jgi:general secretion pathway protein E